jgi:DNA (cytosine-5)-methyltransferase 1
MRNARSRSTDANPAKGSPLRVVELFAGIGGFRLAADARKLSTVWANDADPSACAVYRDRCGPIVHGDIRECLGDVPAHDLLTAGFPCQPFSSAGKKAGTRDPRGTLFQSIVEILDRRRPRFFLLENVKRLLTMERGQHFATILASLAEIGYRVEWRLVNAKDLGLPQNRERVLLVGSRDRRIRLNEPPTAASWQPIARHGRRFPTWGIADGNAFIAEEPTTLADARPPRLLAAVLEDEVAAEFDFTAVTRRWIGRNRPVNRFVGGVEILSNQAGGARMGYTIFGTAGVAPTLTSTTSRHYERYRIGDRYRRLTNIEYARIQGFPDEHCRAVPVREQYRLLGNAVPPPLAEWGLSRLASGGVYPLRKPATGVMSVGGHEHRLH